MKMLSQEDLKKWMDGTLDKEMIEKAPEVLIEQ